MVGPAGEVVGVDGNSAALASAAEAVELLGLGNVRLVKGDVTVIDADDLRAPGGFDVAYSRLTLMHRADPAATIAHFAGRCVLAGRAGGLRPAATADRRAGVTVAERIAGDTAQYGRCDAGPLRNSLGGGLIPMEFGCDQRLSRPHQHRCGLVPVEAGHVGEEHESLNPYGAGERRDQPVEPLWSQPAPGGGERIFEP